MRFLHQPLIALLVCGAIGAHTKPEARAEQIAEQLQPILSCLTGRAETFCISVNLNVTVDGKRQSVDGRLVRFDAQSFDLDLMHDEYSVRIRRRPDSTAFALPHHKVVFLGAGEVHTLDQLAPHGLVDRVIDSGSTLSTYTPMLETADAPAVGQLIRSLLSPTYDAQHQSWAFANDVSLRFFENGKTIDLNVGDQHRLQLTVEESVPQAGAADDWAGFKQIPIQRTELEQTITRGIRRAFEVATPSRLLTSPLQKQRKVPHGELRWVQGQRVVLLSGTPEQVGFAHGSLLKDESQRCLDSVLCTFGTINTIRTGRWFRHDLDSAYQKLAPHIPEDHKRETLAFAKALDWEPHTAQVINVFPELFHCSGFALFGNATKDGKLYHGRVLDYMTTIGLQDSATTFIVAINGKHAFANIGYAGFIGSVSGMNDQSISLGEMGGGGEGQWDGVPMATLMRRALEECATLDEVMDLWEHNPRTCEYYYVFADGKTNRAVGVMAVPESVEFVMPGQTHERLGQGIEDAVVLSAGSRLEKLRERVQKRYGEIDVDVAQWLMSRPVAMESNLHNVLFVPEDGLLYVANASHDQPAANRPYVKLDLRELLRGIGVTPKKPQLADSVAK